MCEAKKNQHKADAAVTLDMTVEFTTYWYFFYRFELSVDENAMPVYCRFLA